MILHNLINTSASKRCGLSRSFFRWKTLNCKKWKLIAKKESVKQAPCLARGHAFIPLPPFPTPPDLFSYIYFLPSLPSLLSYFFSTQHGAELAGRNPYHRISNCISHATMKSQSAMTLQSWDTGLWQALGFFVLFSCSLCQKYWNSRLETQGITCKHSLPLFLCSSLTRRETYS